jgi:polar amino acid transport system ATP-binding protein
MENRSQKKVLQISGVSKSFSGKFVLSDISLDVMQGETVCLLGPSGCGKSTLLRCMNWLEIPDAGSIFLTGQRIGVKEGSTHKMSDRELAQLRAKIGMVFQSFALWPHLSVLDNISLAPIHVLKRNAREVHEQAYELLEKVGLLDKADAFPSNLSGGQKQRVGIARALAMNPKVLLLDEPTSALDPMLVGEVLAVVQSLALEGVTMVVVTHEMEFARQVASKVVFMDEGRIIETGEPKSFFEYPQTEKAQRFLSRFHGLQSH